MAVLSNPHFTAAEGRNREMLKASGSEGKAVENIILLYLDAVNPNLLPAILVI